MFTQVAVKVWLWEFYFEDYLHKATRKADGHFDLTCCSITHVYTMYACTLTSTIYTKGTGTVAPGWVWPGKTMQLATGAICFCIQPLKKLPNLCVQVQYNHDIWFNVPLGPWQVRGGSCICFQAGLAFQHFKVFSKVAREGKEEISLCRVANVKNQPPNFQQLIPCTWRAHWCLNNRTLKLHPEAYTASELYRNRFTWLWG